MWYIMKMIDVYCPAKVNLFLNVTRYDEQTQLHDIVSYNQTINMYDKVSILSYALKTMSTLPTEDFLNIMEGLSVSLNN